MVNGNDSDLHTARLRLRRLTLTDAERMTAIANDIRIARNMTPMFPHPYTLTDATTFISSDPYGFAVELLGPPTANDVGMIGLVGGTNLPVEHTGIHSFGYWFGVNYWGQGYATEAGRAYLDNLVPSTINEPIHRVEASVYGWNPGSGNVLTKLGLELEGRRPNRVTRFGETTDELLYGRAFPLDN